MTVFHDRRMQTRATTTIIDAGNAVPAWIFFFGNLFMRTVFGMIMEEQNNCLFVVGNSPVSTAMRSSPRKECAEIRHDKIVLLIRLSSVLTLNGKDILAGLNVQCLTRVGTRTASLSRLMFRRILSSRRIIWIVFASHKYPLPADHWLGSTPENLR